MGKINGGASFKPDMLQHLNVSLQENAKELAAILESEGFFVHSKAEGSYEVRSLSGPVAVFSLKELPGCCGVVVSYYVDTLTHLRNKGLGSLLLKVRMSAARKQGYGQMMATVLETNKIEQGLLLKAGWVKAGEFRNPKTGNLVYNFVVNL